MEGDLDEHSHVGHPSRANASSALVLCSLGKILASGPFARSPRIARFLRYLVERSLQGSEEELKEYAIGVSVFDRAPDYDQRLDPIVRVEARRLRAKLRAYYDTDGCFDPIRIEIPSRGYVPMFHESDPQSFGGRAQPALQRPGITVAVLPLAGISADPAVDFFADGLTDEIASLMSGIEDVRVVARTSAFQFKGKCGDVRGIGAQLDADYLVEGSVRRENDQVRVSIQLLNAGQGLGVRSRTYDQTVTNVLSAQRLIATQVVEDFKAALVPVAGNMHQELGAKAFSPYAMYLRGRSYLNNRTEEGIKRGIGCFRNLIEHDPQYALAYAGLADSLSLGARYEVFPPQESWSAARSAALKALRIDDSLAEAHTSLAFVDLHYRWDCPSAEQSFFTAISLNPAYVPARQWYAWCLSVTGRHEKAIQNLKQALELDPLSPNVSADLALAYYFARRYEDVVEQCGRTLDLAPGFYRPHQLLGLAYLQQGKYMEAIEEFHQAIALSRGNPKMFVLLALAYALTGQKEQAERVLRELTERRKSFFPGVDLAVLYSAVGDRERMLASLERAYLEHDSELIWLAVDPLYDRVRSDPGMPLLLGRLPALRAAAASDATL